MKDFINRHSVWVVIGIIAIFVLQPIANEDRIFEHIAIAWAMLVSLSSLTLYVYTKYGQAHVDDPEHPLTVYDYLQFAGKIIIAIALLIGLIYLAEYQSLWNSALIAT